MRPRWYKLFGLSDAQSWRNEFPLALDGSAAEDALACAIRFMLSLGNCCSSETRSWLSLSAATVAFTPGMTVNLYQLDEGWSSYERCPHKIAMFTVLDLQLNAIAANVASCKKCVPAGRQSLRPSLVFILNQRNSVHHND